MSAGVKALLVEDGNQRGVLAAVRTLGAAGWEIGIASPHRGLAGRSRWTRHWHEAPAPSAGLGPFVDALQLAAERECYDVAFGGGDAEVLALSALRHRLRVPVLLPPHDVVRRAFDKAALSEAAVHAGLAVPRSFHRGDVQPDVPVVVKERLHGDPTAGAATLHQAPQVVAPEEVPGRTAEIRAGGGAPVLQEVVEGELLALILLVDRDGTVAAAAQQRTTLMWPPEAGVSVRARSTPVDLELLGRASVLLRDLGWFGLVQLQFIAPPSGAPRLIDFNGRFFGSLQLSVAAGIDLPGALTALVRGRAMTVQPLPATEVRYQWLEGDLRRAVQQRQRGLARDVIGCLRFARGATHSTWMTSDPWPATALALDLLGRAPRKVLGRVRR